MDIIEPKEKAIAQDRVIAFLRKGLNMNVASVKHDGMSG